MPLGPDHQLRRDQCNKQAEHDPDGTRNGDKGRQRQQEQDHDDACMPQLVDDLTQVNLDSALSDPKGERCESSCGNGLNEIVAVRRNYDLSSSRRASSGIGLRGCCHREPCQRW